MPLSEENDVLVGRCFREIRERIELLIGCGYEPGEIAEIVDQMILRQPAAH